MTEFSKRAKEKLSKLSESQLESLFSEVTARNEILDSIIQSLNTGLISLDKDWNLLTINTAAECLLPFSSNPEELRSEKIWQLIGDDEIKSFLKDCHDKNRINITEEFSITTSGGSVRFVEISLSPLMMNSKNAGTIIRIYDVTQDKNKEILLHRMEALAGLTNIAASVAHEIKNPLGAISIHIQLMQKAIKKKRESDGKLPDEKFVENYLDIINEEIDRLNKIVVDFLVAVRPVSANLELSSVDKLIDDYLSFFKPEFDQKNISIDRKSCEPSPRILIDPKLFRDLFVNFAQNSMQALEEKDCEKIFSVRTFIRDDKYILMISDNGCGMNQETVSRVFEPYYTTKANGTGLGMSMAYKIIKEFNGEINVESEEGKGTVFTIQFPVPQNGQKLLCGE